MFAAVVVLALSALLAVGLLWRSRRAALANRLLHMIVAAMEALETGGAVERANWTPDVSASVLLGSKLSGRVEAFFQAAADPAGDRERAFELGGAVLRDLRDISTHRSHELVSRA
jgi:hypothetical protein